MAGRSHGAACLEINSGWPVDHSDRSPRTQTLRDWSVPVSGPRAVWARPMWIERLAAIRRDIRTPGAPDRATSPGRPQSFRLLGKLQVVGSDLLTTDQEETFPECLFPRPARRRRRLIWPRGRRSRLICVGISVAACPSLQFGDVEYRGRRCQRFDAHHGPRVVPTIDGRMIDRRPDDQGPGDWRADGRRQTLPAASYAVTSCACPRGRGCASSRTA
jgi:hypothetical protein